MRITPKTDEQLAQERIGLKPGIITFEIINAEEKISKNGNEMIQIILKVWDEEGQEGQVYDYLLDSMGFKVKHLCEGVGLIDKYNAGELRQGDLVGKCGKAIGAIQADKTGRYPDKYVIRDYMKEPAKPKDDLDDIPM